MKLSRIVAAGLLGAVLGAPGTSNGAIMFFGSRAAWLAAVGGTDAAESFSSFGVDTQFRTVSVGLNGGMSIRREGVDATNFRNLVDVPPLAFTDNNGTSNASCYVNFPEAGSPGCQVRVSFDILPCGWGADFYSASGGEGMVFEVVSTSGAVLASTPATASSGSEFIGFKCTAGERVGSVRLVSQSLTAGTGGEGFGMDDIAIRFAIRAFTSRAAWLAAAGASEATENFSSFGVDTDFKPAPVPIRGTGKIGQSGANPTAFRNIIDAPPLMFGDNNGTTNASCYTDFPEAGPGTNVLLTYDNRLRAWGADFYDANGLEGLDIDVRIGSAVLRTLSAVGIGGSEFIGLIACPGYAVDNLFLHSRTLTPGTGGEGFGMDDIVQKYFCYPDCTDGGVLDVNDFICFQTKYALHDSYADCDNNGIFNINDFVCFQTKFALGCP